MHLSIIAIAALLLGLGVASYLAIRHGRHRASEQRFAGPRVDPVCGMQVDPRRAAAKVRYRGKTYYFCSLACRDDFRKAGTSKRSGCCG